jgi:hypothetical protein
MTRTAVAALAALALTASAAPAQQKKAKNDDLFGPGKVWTMHIKLSSAAYDEMQPKNPPKFGPGAGFPKGKGPAPKGKDKGEARGLFGLDFAYVKGAVEIDGKTIDGVGVRF